MSSLTVICPNFRRHVIKVTPGTLLRKVVEEACLKSGYDVDSCVVRNQKKIVDLALPFRLSGLANNSTLEIEVVDKPKSSDVEIALQLPDGRRQIAKLPVSSTLKDVVAHFSGVFGEDLLSSAEGLPSCVYMNRKYVGPDLGHNSLNSIGITGGKCLIRYQKVQVSAEELAELEAKAVTEMQRIALLSNNFDRAQKENEERARLEAERLSRFQAELKAKEEEEARKRQEVVESMEVDQAPVPDRLPDMPTPQGNSWSFDSPFAAQSASTAPVPPPQTDRLAHLNSLLQRVDQSLATGAPDNMVRVMADAGRVSITQIATASEVMDTEQSQPEPVFSEPCERRACIFARAATPDREVPAGSAELPDEFFEVNADDVKNMQKDLKKQVRMYTQRSLLPRTFVEKKNRELKLAAYRHSVIRFVLGDLIIQANFDSGEPVCRLFDFISSVLTKERVKFSLTAVLNHPVTSSDSKNLIDEELAPKTTLTVKLNTPTDIQSLMKADVPRCSHSEADSISADWLSCNTRFSPYTGAQIEEPAWIGKRPAGMSDAQTHETHKPAGAPGPKWFKMSK